MWPLLRDLVLGEDRVSKEHRACFTGGFVDQVQEEGQLGDRYRAHCGNFRAT